MERSCLLKSFTLLVFLQERLGTWTAFVSFKFVMGGAGWGRREDVGLGTDLEVGSVVGGMQSDGQKRLVRYTGHASWGGGGGTGGIACGRVL